MMLFFPVVQCSCSCYLQCWGELLKTSCFTETKVSEKKKIAEKIKEKERQLKKKQEEIKKRVRCSSRRLDPTFLWETGDQRSWGSETASLVLSLGCVVSGPLGDLHPDASSLRPEPPGCLAIKVAFQVDLLQTEVHCPVS